MEKLLVLQFYVWSKATNWMNGYFDLVAPDLMEIHPTGAKIATLTQTKGYTDQQTTIAMNYYLPIKTYLQC